MGEKAELNALNRQYQQTKITEINLEDIRVNLVSRFHQKLQESRNLILAN